VKPSLVLLSLSLLGACAVALEDAPAAAPAHQPDTVEDAVTASNTALETDAWLQRPSPMPTLPHAGGAGVLTPWGGPEAARWRPEAVLANAVSDALNRAWRQDGVADVTVSVPVHMLSSTFHEYGDGQSNAAVELPHWSGRRPPLLAVRTVHVDQTVGVRFVLDGAVPVQTMELLVRAPHPAGVARLPLRRAADGTLVASWNPPTTLGLQDVRAGSVILVKPVGWEDWFVVRFHVPVRSIQALKATVPLGLQKFSDGGDIVDHEGVSVQSLPGLTAFNRITGRVLGSAYNQQPYTPDAIHARFPSAAGDVVTGVGRGWTWVANPPAAPFKVLYTCFERRRADLEAAAPHGGVVSGGGWHLIGDAAETILNDLEPVPLAVAFASRNVVPASQLPSGAHAYGLTDVAVFRLLQPGEAFITRRGAPLVDADGTVWPQDNFHWFFFQQEHNVCTEEWVHPCVPNDALDFGCGEVAVEVRAQVNTAWGQHVVVVGDAPALGGWDVTRALELSPQPYPSWRGRVVLPPGGTVRFKLVKLDGGGNVVWEAGGDRVLDVPQQIGVSLDLTWR